MFAGLQGWHIVIILVVVVLLFGAPKLPGLAKSIGQSMRIFKSEVKQLKDEKEEGKKDEFGNPIAEGEIIEETRTTVRRDGNTEPPSSTTR